MRSKKPELNQAEIREAGRKLLGITNYNNYH